jgi:hypothetical protein
MSQLSRGLVYGVLLPVGQLYRQFPKLNLVERDTGCIYARFVAGRLLWIDADVLAGASIDAEAHAARYAAAPEIFSVPWPRHGLA